MLSVRRLGLASPLAKCPRAAGVACRPVSPVTPHPPPTPPGGVPPGGRGGWGGPPNSCRASVAQAPYYVENTPKKKELIVRSFG